MKRIKFFTTASALFILCFSVGVGHAADVRAVKQPPQILPSTTQVVSNVNTIAVLPATIASVEASGQHSGGQARFEVRLTGLGSCGLSFKLWQGASERVLHPSPTPIIFNPPEIASFEAPDPKDYVYKGGETAQFLYL
jgi:hypothetical protein